ncbi:hypothetical protein EDC01DRAFT_779928 [Geopyxis carbonaria]|nr:hypothetical protein EDC01DRAFT_779928 [Geopyxis carbonaria]
MELDYADPPSSQRRPKKRLKTLRACDQCRKLHVRCEEPTQPGQPASTWPISELEQELEELSRQRRRLTRCGRCLRMDIDCTFFLPIDETRPRRGVRGESATSGGDEKTPEVAGDANAAPRKHDDDYLDAVTTWASTHFPILTPASLSTPPTKSTVLLKSVLRLSLSRLSPSAPSTAALESFIHDYLLLHDPSTGTSTSTASTIQSLLLLTLFTPDLHKAGAHFTTAVRTACAAHWHLRSSPIATNRPAVADYLWYALVAVDTALYTLTGVPPLITPASYDLPPPKEAPPFWTAVVTLTDILRALVRPDDSDHASPDPHARLAAWELAHPAPPLDLGPALTTASFLTLLHATVAAVFALHAPPSDPGERAHRRALCACALRLQCAAPDAWRGVAALAMAGRMCALAVMVLRGKDGGAQEEEALLREWRGVVGGEVFDGVSVLAAVAAAEGAAGRGWEVVLLLPRG